MAVTPDGRRAVSASADDTLKVWDLESGRELHTLSGHAHSVFTVAVRPDGRRAVSASAYNIGGRRAASKDILLRSRTVFASDDDMLKSVGSRERR